MGTILIENGYAQIDNNTAGEIRTHRDVVVHCLRFFNDKIHVATGQ